MNKSNMEIDTNRIRNMRIERGITAAEAAKIIGIGVSTLRKIELGQRPLHPDEALRFMREAMAREKGVVRVLGRPNRGIHTTSYVDRCERELAAVMKVQDLIKQGADKARIQAEAWPCEDVDLLIEQGGYSKSRVRAVKNKLYRARYFERRKQ
jgi:DNA-binding XRE family transcriptional regulator